jgi:glycine/D-amino acid oxidase-like deaminating enzyme/nitrite reductase/ring-hydroxylating ferredoxin subunit
MKDKSIWLDGITRKKFGKLDKDIDCDILIIGGGITGISCGYFLKDSNKKIVLVERNKLCTSTTAKSTGKLTYLQDDMINKIKNVYDEEIALKYIKSQKEAISLAKKIILENDIKCNLTSVNSYIFNNKGYNNYKVYENYHLFKKCGIVKIKDNIPIKTKCYNSLEVNDTFVFHPVKFVLGLSDIISKNIDIYENTNVLYIDHKDDYYLVKTRNGLITTKKIILACHYPFFLFPYLFPMKTSLEKAFLVASLVDKSKSFSAINIDKEVMSLRYHKDKKNYLITVSEVNSLDKNINNLKKRDNAIWNMRRRFSPNIKYCWSNYDIMTWDYLPLVGEIDNNLYIATGYNTWGMTNGILAGKILSDLILERPNPYISLFDPKRDVKNIPRIVNFNIKNACSFINTKLNKNKTFYRNDVKIINEDGTWYGIYIDENKKEHKVLNLCPHMKCNLSFNYQNKSWDCPCHGSSFDIDGNLIYGPSTYSIKVPKK